MLEQDGQLGIDDPVSAILSQVVTCGVTFSEYDVSTSSPVCVAIDRVVYINVLIIAPLKDAKKYDCKIAGGPHIVHGIYCVGARVWDVKSNCIAVEKLSIASCAKCV